mgnify:CR=1 FL=1
MSERARKRNGREGEKMRKGKGKETTTTRKRENECESEIPESECYLVFTCVCLTQINRKSELHRERT